MHRRLYGGLKGIGNDDASQKCIMTEGAFGKFKIHPQKKQPLWGLILDEMKDVIAHFVCLTDSH